MFPAGFLRTPRTLIALIVAITVVPLATLSWLGWRLLQQDRALEHQQVQQRVERGADLIVAALQRFMSASKQRLAAGAAAAGEGAVTVMFRADQAEVSPRDCIAYLPMVTTLPEAPAAAFSSQKRSRSRVTGDGDLPVGQAGDRGHLGARERFACARRRRSSVFWL
jgi:hypothetical protein